MKAKLILLLLVMTSCSHYEYQVQQRKAVVRDGRLVMVGDWEKYDSARVDTVYGIRYKHIKTNTNEQRR